MVIEPEGSAIPPRGDELTMGSARRREVASAAWIEAHGCPRHPDARSGDDPEHSPTLDPGCDYRVATIPDYSLELRVIGEYFSARPDEIDQELVELGPSGRFEIVSAKTHSSVTTGTLGEILGLGDSEDLTAQTETDWYGESGECGIDAIPTALRDALAEASDLFDVAKQWTATDELRLVGWTVEETHEVLRSLARLAADARASGRELWFYWTL
jgi:hypothetical protein